MFQLTCCVRGVSVDQWLEVFEGVWAVQYEQV